MVFTISQGKRFCYNVLSKIVPSVVVINYTYLSITLCQIMGGACAPDFATAL